MPLRILLLGSVLICLQPASLSNTQSPQQSKNEPDNIPTVDFCGLVRNRSKYEGTAVRTKVRYTVGPESMSVHDPRCEEEAWAEFDADYRERTKEEVLKSFNQLMRPIRSNTWGEFNQAELVAVGLLIHRPEGVGHLGAFKYKFVISSVEKAESVPKE